MFSSDAFNMMMVTSVIGFGLLFALGGAGVGLVCLAPFMLWTHSLALLPWGVGLGSAAGLGFMLWSFWGPRWGHR